MRVGLTVDIEAAMADLATIDQVVPAQAQRIIARASQRFEGQAKARTPVGASRKAAGRRLSTGWQRRVAGPLRVHIANIRPHAHLAAEGWDHVSGKRIAAFVPWIGQAVAVRDDMVDELTATVQGGFPQRLRALEVTP